MARVTNDDRDNAVYGEGRPLFDVTVRTVVGSVYQGGQYTPTEAAFLIIAKADCDGTFEFPNDLGERMIVTVSRVEQSINESIPPKPYSPSFRD